MEALCSKKIEESDKIEKEKVKLNRCWSFWENYEIKSKSEKGYSDLIKEIYSFDDIISFWQFWNKYPGNDTKKIFYNGEYLTYFFKEKYRISAMNLFVKGIKPEWEDVKNKKGKIYVLEFEIKKDLDLFLSRVSDLWVKLLILLIGEQIPFSNNINGIRFVDKTKLGKGTIFKFEIWINSSMTDENEIDNLKSFLSKNFGTSGILIKNIP
jgi:hypothetical protein